MKIGNALSRVVQSIYAIALTDRVSSHVVMRKLLSGAESMSSAFPGWLNLL